VNADAKTKGANSGKAASRAPPVYVAAALANNRAAWFIPPEVPLADGLINAI